jgi:hypothetical protein
MNKYTNCLCYRNLLGSGFQRVQGRLHVLDLMALTASTLIHLLLVHPVAVTILARIMSGRREPSFFKFPVTVGARHTVIDDMQIVVKRQFCGILITAHHRDQGAQQYG